ncbi:MAG: hypothetical protein IKF72_15100 [Kiritimatiellae bacterium]|nr:hypothetical protein [Kiritimatiellia bacterium]
MITGNDSGFLGIELGSTRIKAGVIDGSGAVLAKGAFAWENRPLADNVWSYGLADASCRGISVTVARSAF